MTDSPAASSPGSAAGACSAPSSDTLFKVIHDCSGTDWREMYQVFNMGHRMEIYVRPEVAQQVIAVSESFGIEARVVGHIEEGQRSLTIQSEFGEYNY